jgi:hypothetical protein
MDGRKRDRTLEFLSSATKVVVAAAGIEGGWFLRGCIRRKSKGAGKGSGESKS